MRMKITLEDDYTDIIRKAQRGLQITDAQLAKLAGIPRDARDEAPLPHRAPSSSRRW